MTSMALAHLLQLSLPTFLALEAGNGVSYWEKVRIDRWLENLSLIETPDWKPLTKADNPRKNQKKTNPRKKNTPVAGVAQESSVEVSAELVAEPVAEASLPEAPLS